MTTENSNDFEVSLNKLFLLLSYEPPETDSILNKVSIVLSDHIPLTGIVLKAFYNGTISRIASVGCLDDVFTSRHELEMREDALQEMSMDERFSKVDVACFSGNDPLLHKILKTSPKTDVNLLYVPFGAFIHFPGFAYLLIFLPAGTRHIPAYIDCCKRFQPILTFLASLLFRNNDWRPENGRLIRTEGGCRNAQAGAPLSDTSFQTLEELNRAYIEKTLRLTAGRVAGRYGAACKLGLKPTTLWAKIRKYGIEVPKA